MMAQSFVWEQVIAIDFGTTRTGYAILRAGSSNVEVRTNWEGNVEQHYKNLTIILYDTNTLTPLSWGFEAVDMYKRKIRAKETNMRLINDIKLNLNKLQDPNEKLPKIQIGSNSVSTIKVIADFLTLVVATIRKQNPEINIEATKWCLTVPAIWNDAMREAMKQAAEEAGLVKQTGRNEEEQFTLALEPEAAAVCCLKSREIRLKNNDLFVIVDAGGGTVDITSYQVVNDKLRQKYKASGEACGGTMVDRAWWKYVDRIFESKLGISDFTASRLQPHFAFLDFQSNWEAAKIFFVPGDSAEVSISIPNQINNSILAKIDFIDELGSFYSADSSEFIISSSDMESLFTESVEETLDYTREAIEETLCASNAPSIDYLMLVGGYSRSIVLTKAIQKANFNVKQILMPHNGGEAIAFGAAHYGASPTIIQTRRLLATYGLAVSRLYNPNLHANMKVDLITQGEQKYFIGFEKFFSVNEEVEPGTTISKSYRLLPTHYEVGYVPITILKTNNANALTREYACVLAKIKLNLFTNSRAALPQEISVQFQFGNTQLHVTARDNSGEAVIVEIAYEALN